MRRRPGAPLPPGAITTRFLGGDEFRRGVSCQPLGSASTGGYMSDQKTNHVNPDLFGSIAWFYCSLCGFMGFQSKSFIEAIKSISKNLLFPSSIPPGILLRQSERRIGIDRGMPGKPASMPREEIF
jgi:hypothetical protein